MIPLALRGRASMFLPTLFALLGVLFLGGLGMWQLGRKAEKERLIARIEERLAGPPAPLPAPGEWDSLRREDAEFRRVFLEGEPLNGKEALVYTTGSALRPDVSGAGYWVMLPYRVAGGAIVVVNRGFLPQPRKDAGVGSASESARVIGALRWPEERGLFTPTDNPGRKLFFTRDPEAIAAAEGLPRPAPFYVEQETQADAAGWPRAGRLQAALPNNHLQYALTWFGLALALVAVYAVWAYKQLFRGPE